MKIIIISPGILPVPGIKGGAVETLIDLLINYNEITKQHNLIVYSVYDTNLYNVEHKYQYCDFKYIKLSPLYLFISRYFYSLINRILPIYLGNPYIHKVLKDIRNINNYDAIIVENVIKFGLLLKKKDCKNVILHLHNDYLNVKSKRPKEIVNSYEKIFCVSNYINSKTSSILKDKKIITLYNGINIKNFDRNLYKDKYIDLRNQYKIKSSDIVIIYTGRLVPEKGIKELLEAFIGLKKASNIKLVIVGSSFFEGATKSKFIRRLELLARESKDKIIFTGYLPYHKMPEIYSIADIGIVPSIWEEPFGLTLIEQMAMSLPIIASDSGAFNEIINEKCSIIVKRGPNYINSLMIALDQLILNDKLRILLGQEARIQAELFTSEVYCKRFYTLIDKESNNG